MKEIVIRNVVDLEKLNSISKKDHIFLKIGKEFNHVTFSAVSLKGFKGTIDVWFEDLKQKYSFMVLTNSIKQMQFFFKDASEANIFIVKDAKYFVKYKEKRNTQEVSNFLEFQQALNANFDIMLMKDIVLPEEFLLPKKKIRIDGKGHYIYANQKTIQAFSNHFFVFNVSFFPVTQVIRVFQLPDFYKVLKYPYDTVVLVLENNIENQEMIPISLKKFYGTVIILGNQNRLSNIKLLDNFSNSIGFISDLSHSANLICSDLTFEKIHFPETDKENVGCILGARSSMIGSYASPAGKTIFTNCTVEKTKMLKGNATTGVIAGLVDDNAECFDCNAAYILGCPGHTYFGNQVYCDQNNLVVASNYIGKKRISFHGGSKRRNRSKL